MALVKVKPTSAGRRSLVKVVNPTLHKGAPVASLVESQKRGSGRNNNGHITMRHKGGGHKQHYRIVDFKRNKDGIAGEGRAARIRPEPQRQHRAPAVRGRRAPLHHRAARRRGRHAAACRASRRRIKPGNCLPLRNIPVGTTVHCIEMQPGKGAQIARSAGASVQLLAREGIYAQLRLRSGEIRKVHVDCRADDRRSRQRGAQPALDRQGGRASAGAASGRRCAASR